MKPRTYTTIFSTPEDKPHGILTVINEEGTAESTFPVTQETARLALAAPKLLAACKVAVSLSIALPYGLREEIEAAIAEAEGRTA